MSTEELGRDKVMGLTANQLLRKILSISIRKDGERIKTNV